jgi:hypothetical protein
MRVRAKIAKLAASAAGPQKLRAQPCKTWRVAASSVMTMHLSEKDVA